MNERDQRTLNLSDCGTGQIVGKNERGPNQGCSHLGDFAFFEIP